MSVLTQEAQVQITLQLCCDAIIGIYPRERLTPQQVRIDLDITLQAQQYWWCALYGDLSHSIDYAFLRDICLWITQEGHFRLLESLLATIARSIFRISQSQALKSQVTEPQTTEHPILNLHIKASKPNIFEDGSQPSVSLKLSPHMLPALPPSPIKMIWKAQEVNDPTIGEISTSPKRLRHTQADLQVLCDLPEVYIAHLTAQPQQLSVLTLPQKSATFLLAGSWFGVLKQGSASTRPQPLSLKEKISGSRFKELWCLEGGEALVIDQLEP